ncbi:hypothetical protein [Spirosoma foliorum]|uniref:Uncharacterized protein n=1 Tax=Spirosoma foliorum TaxID=2710596 RepID=A0A7G5GQY0_9BACT|nr:hypothetical protein [Spirosoma foliorum]QMW01272.1 hypothetical protein H3H32_25360 [Spirosoma foliorum]
MKQKPDEFPDQWVRQTLSQLPDTPPPGSAFNSERLWGQLRPELEQTPARRLTGWVWWAAAACLLALALGYFWLYTSTSKHSIVATGNHKPKRLLTNQYQPNSSADVARSKPVVDGKEKPVLALQKHRDQKETRKAKTTPFVTEPIEAVAQTTEVPRSIEVSLLVESEPEAQKPSVAMSAPKHRFKVVHENELRSEEETRPKLYPAENFVRIGTGGRAESVSDGSRPAFTLPLTHKPNQ